jgi:hypothetical protein
MLNHGLIEVVAYQETLLIMAVFGIVMLTMLWVGFRRWLQARERTDRLLREQAAEQSSQFGAYIERVEARLKAIEHKVTDDGVQTPAQIDKATDPQALASAKRDRAPR